MGSAAGASVVSGTGVASGVGSGVGVGVGTGVGSGLGSSITGSEKRMNFTRASSMVPFAGMAYTNSVYSSPWFMESELMLAVPSLVLVLSTALSPSSWISMW